MARAAHLAAFAAGDLAALVATDLAARGLDLPVALVVQADFALDAAAYLHRAGRTGRTGGAPGRVLSLVRPGDAALAAAIAEAVRAGAPLAPVFSRNRSWGKAQRRAAAEVAVVN